MHTTPDASTGEPQPKSEPGHHSDVTWDGGAGDQPYANRGKADAPDVGAAQDVPAGNRGEHSAQTVDQADQAAGTP